MNHFVVLAYTLALGQLVPQYVLCKLNAVTDFHPWYVNRIYLHEERNLDEPILLDPATTDRSARLQICDDISRSGVFAGYGLIPVDLEDVYDELQKPKNEDIFHCLYKAIKVSQDAQRPPQYEYYNPYRRLEFDITKYFPHNPDAESMIVRRAEYGFMCLLKVAESNEEYYVDSEEPDEEREGFDKEDLGADNEEEKVQEEKKKEEEESSEPNSEDEEELSEEEEEEEDSGDSGDSDDSDEKKAGDIVVFFVSKLYDAHHQLHAHRFIHLEKGKFDDEEMMLVEHSATAYLSPDFDVETHYLALREYQQPVSHCDRDPVCKLNLGSFEYNQRFQLCAIVLKSAYFEGKVEYPHRVYHRHWFRRRIYFETAQGKQKADGKPYYEFTLTCETSMIDNDINIFYVSRAYNPNQVFVYTDVEDKLYLETLVTNVSVVHEPNCN